MTTRGWKSGNSHRIEIWFVELEGIYYIVSSEMRENSHWVSERQARLIRHLQGWEENVHGFQLGDKKVEPALFAAVKKQMESKYKWGDGLIVELTPVTARETSG
ncbi:MAG: hypothetical protein HYY68_05240 [Thaumarchaeota archaeon]|nr:hypothetical protein [Nitrososphaerota archaeon]